MSLLSLIFFLFYLNNWRLDGCSHDGLIPYKMFFREFTAIYFLDAYKIHVELNVADPSYTQLFSVSGFVVSAYGINVQ